MKLRMTLILSLFSSLFIVNTAWAHRPHKGPHPHSVPLKNPPSSSPTDFKRGFYVAISPVAGVSFGLTTEDITLRTANLALGIDVNEHVAFQLEFDYDYFIQFDQIGDYHLFNYALVTQISPMNGRVRPYVFGGVGAYTYMQESARTSKLITDLSVTGGIGIGVNITTHHAIDLKAGPRFYRGLQTFNGVIDNAWAAATATLMYKYTF